MNGELAVCQGSASGDQTDITAVETMDLELMERPASVEWVFRISPPPAASGGPRMADINDVGFNRTVLTILPDS
jgi:hypothetical protein